MAQFRLLLVPALLLASSCIDSAPRDEELLRRFPEARPHLEEVIRTLPQGPRPLLIYRQGMRANVSAEEGSALLAQLEHVGVGGLGAYDDHVMFIVAAAGIVGHGWAKGFVYIPDSRPNLPLRADLDASGACQHHHWALREISDAPGWYLFLEC